MASKMTKKGDFKLSDHAKQESRLVANLIEPLIQYIAELTRENFELKGIPYYDEEHSPER